MKKLPLQSNAHLVSEIVILKERSFETGLNLMSSRTMFSELQTNIGLLFNIQTLDIVYSACSFEFSKWTITHRTLHGDELWPQHLFGE